jgi:ACS family tartrate transporter-like MFS transporter
MSAAAAAASIGLINSFGNLGGAVGPTVVGIVRDSTGSYSAGLRFLAVSMVISAAIIITLGIGRNVRARPEPASRVRRKDAPGRYRLASSKDAPGR